MATKEDRSIATGLCRSTPVAGAIAFIVLAAIVASACGSNSQSGFNPGVDASTDSSTTPGAEASAPAPTPEDGGTGTFNYDGAPPKVCRPGLYTGTFTGTYSSSLTLIGVPLPVTGNLSMTLEQSSNGGEVPVYTIANGSISGLAYSLFPFYCSLVGTLDCGAQKLEGGMLDCQYCVGTVTGSLGDGGTCSSGARFKGPMNANYDSNSFAFTDGTWNGSEEVTDAGATINDAGVYIGPGDYGGSGTWTATSQNGDP